MIQENELLQTYTGDYEPPYQSWSPYLYDQNRAMFTEFAIDAMLCDSRVTLGNAILRGPIISNSRFYVDSKDPKVKEFVARQINRFWGPSCGIEIALQCTDYGRQPAEIVYRNRDGMLQFDKLRHLHPRSCKARTLKGHYIGMDVSDLANRTKPIFLAAQKAFWTVHRRHRHRWYGDSQLRSAFPDWYEKWAIRGYRDQRQLFFFKNAFQGPTLYCPNQSQPAVLNSDGTAVAGAKPVHNKVLGQRIVDKYASGSGVVLCEDVAPGQSVRGWELIPPTSVPAPEGLLTYGHDLDDGIWEGMEIPPGILESKMGEGGGISIGGGEDKSIVQQGFYSILQGICQWRITDFDEQVLSPLVTMNFSASADYEIECFGLLRKDNQEGGQGDMAQQALGEPAVDGNDADPTRGLNASQMSDGAVLSYDRLSPEKIAAQRFRQALRRRSQYNFIHRRSA